MWICRLSPSPSSVVDIMSVVATHCSYTQTVLRWWWAGWNISSFACYEIASFSILLLFYTTFEIPPISGFYPVTFTYACFWHKRCTVFVTFRFLGFNGICVNTIVHPLPQSVYWLGLLHPAIQISPSGLIHFKNNWQNYESLSTSSRLAMGPTQPPV
jgi:hypothetical protein